MNNTAVNGPKMRILIVEDEFIVGLHLESILERLGHDIIGVVADEAEALYLVFSEQPDLIITDIHLAGGGNGLRVAQEAREKYGAQTVVITGHRDGGTFLKAEEAGAMAFLRKPFGLTEVENVFSRLSS
ncbi:response regulator [Flaviflagellibacter deserti]|uniref:Response regulator n=1 Tax=Flaviflagellibacter deserti TaxID=2267266 RepID=A0ABV9Z294_9HYPH